MQTIFNLLTLLLIVMATNILTGTLYGIDYFKKFKSFEWKKLVGGVIKALSVASAFFGLAYVLECLPEISEELGILPSALLIVAIGIYAYKTTQNLKKILGV